MPRLTPALFALALLGCPPTDLPLDDDDDSAALEGPRLECRTVYPGEKAGPEGRRCWSARILSDGRLTCSDLYTNGGDWRLWVGEEVMPQTAPGYGGAYNHHALRLAGEPLGQLLIAVEGTDRSMAGDGGVYAYADDDLSEPLWWYLPDGIGVWPGAGAHMAPDGLWLAGSDGWWRFFGDPTGLRGQVEPLAQFRPMRGIEVAESSPWGYFGGFHTEEGVRWVCAVDGNPNEGGDREIRNVVSCYQWPSPETMPGPTCIIDLGQNAGWYADPPYYADPEEMAVGRFDCLARSTMLGERLPFAPQTARSVGPYVVAAGGGAVALLDAADLSLIHLYPRPLGPGCGWTMDVQGRTVVMSCLVPGGATIETSEAHGLAVCEVVD